MIKTLYKKIISERQRNNLRFAAYKLRSLFYRGDQYYCICCDTSFRCFITYGNDPRPNALCPSCHSLERTRVLMYYLQREVKLFDRSLKFLHFAPERALEKKIKAHKSTSYFTADINSNLADHVVDILSIPFDNDTFNLIVCSHVLGHVADEAKAINEMLRVLKPNGEAIIMTVINSLLENTFEDDGILSESDRLKQYGESDLLRKHGQDFEQRLQRKDWTVIAKDYRLTFSAEEQRCYSLGNGNREVIFSCKKN